MPTCGTDNEQERGHHHRYEQTQTGKMRSGAFDHADGGAAVRLRLGGGIRQRTPDDHRRQRHHWRCTRCHSRRNTDAGRCRAFFRTRPRGAERTDTHRLLIPRGVGDPQRGTCRICKKHRLSGYRRQASCRRYSTRAAQNSRLLGGSLSCARASPKYLASTALSHLSHAR